MRAGVHTCLGSVLALAHSSKDKRKILLRLEETEGIRGLALHGTGEPRAWGAMEHRGSLLSEPERVDSTPPLVPRHPHAHCVPVNSSSAI